jgi:hypothetical protein
MAKNRGIESPMETAFKAPANKATGPNSFDSGTPDVFRKHKPTSYGVINPVQFNDMGNLKPTGRNVMDSPFNSTQAIDRLPKGSKK